MSVQDLLARPWQPKLGAALFAASLAGLVAAAPNLVSIAGAIGGVVVLAWFLVARSRRAVVLLTVLMLIVSGCALFDALLVDSLLLLPVAGTQILAILLFDSIASRAWSERAGAMSADGTGVRRRINVAG